MQKDEAQKLEELMKQSLDSKNSPNKRVYFFHKLYNKYIDIGKKDENWDVVRIRLREKFANKLSTSQRKKYSITKMDLKKSYYELQKNIQKNNYPVELFYEISLALIQKICKKGERILDIGYGYYPILVNLLNKKGYNAIGIDPFAKQFDNEKTFKCTIKNLPKDLEKKEFNIILANMVYSINYTSHFSKKFNYELANRKRLLKKLSELLDKKGFLILVDDIGTIFSKRDLKQHFKILLFEKDLEIFNFSKNKAYDFAKVTLLQKK